jgi:hypothetical protein
VQNLHKVYAVVRGGKFYSTDALKALKQKVAEDLKSDSAGSAKHRH